MRVRVAMWMCGLLLTSLVAEAGRHRAAPTAPTAEYEGVIKTVASGTITVTTSHKTDVVFTINAATLIRKGDTTVDVSTLAVGDQVHVKATSANNVNTALIIIVQQPESSEDPGDSLSIVTANGYVTKVGADSIDVHRANGTDATVKVTDGTVIRKHGQTIHLADIKVGDHVEAVGTAVDPTTIAALQIEVEDANPSESNRAEVNGTVTGTGTSSLTISKTYTVNVDSNTHIRKSGKDISLSGVQVGDFVQAEGSRVDATTILASEIQVSGGGGHH
ncbi:MAG TPA: DUF5666 domain-containing protein [Thermoanaerobaculia bacterium]|nr:DUF5666 domain-containing protein [Thermoanaerobaculia bacterium]